MNLHDDFMQIAIEEARQSGEDVHVGAVIVYRGSVISKAHNQKELLKDVSAQAEILAIREAAKILNNWRLDGATMYVTLEPCPMCATAIINSRISEVYFGASDNIYGALGTVLDLRNVFNSNLKVKSGLLEADCETLLKNFWRKNNA